MKFSLGSNSRPFVQETLGDLGFEHGMLESDRMGDFKTPFSFSMAHAN